MAKSPVGWCLLHPPCPKELFVLGIMYNFEFRSSMIQCRFQSIRDNFTGGAFLVAGLIAAHLLEHVQRRLLTRTSGTTMPGSLAICCSKSCADAPSAT